LTTILKKFPKGRVEPKWSEPTVRKYSERLREMNPSQRPYLENFQEVEGMNPCRCPYLESLLRGGMEPKKG
jgi:hypothetical protein